MKSTNTVKSVKSVKATNTVKSVKSVKATKATEKATEKTTVQKSAWLYDVLTMHYCSASSVSNAQNTLNDKNTILLSIVRKWYAQQKNSNGAKIGVNTLLCRFAIIGAKYPSMLVDDLSKQTLTCTGKARREEYFTVNDLARVVGIIDGGLSDKALKVLITRDKHGNTQLLLRQEYPENVTMERAEKAKQKTFTIDDFKKRVESLIETATASKLDVMAMRKILASAC